MAYIGKTPTVGNFVKLDALTASATASYTMQVDSVNFNPESVNHMMVSLNGVIQAPTTSYTISGSTITFASTLASSDSIDFIMVYGNVLDIGVPSDATVTNAKTNFVSTSSAAGLQIKGDGTTDGTLQLNCSQNSHGIKLKSPPHSASASYTLTFPNDDGDADQVLKTNGSGVLDWVDSGSGTHVLLGSTNVTSNVGYVTFQSLFSDTYTNYYLSGRGITKSTSSHVQLRFMNGGTTDSGTNYDAVYGEGVKSRNSNTWVGRHNSQNEIQFMESATVTTGTFTMWIDTSFRGTSPHNYVNLHGIESHWIGDSNGFVTTTFGGVYLPNTNVDGITIIVSSGTIDSGRFSLYGVKHA